MFIVSQIPDLKEETNKGFILCSFFSMAQFSNLLLSLESLRDIPLDFPGLGVYSIMADKTDKLV